MRPITNLIDIFFFSCFPKKIGVRMILTTQVDEPSSYVFMERPVMIIKPVSM